MKESHKKTLSNLKVGFVKLAKLIWIIIKSFFEAITWDFYNNIKKYWKQDLKETEDVPKTEDKLKSL